MNPLISDFQTRQQRTPVIVAPGFTSEKDTPGFVRNLNPTLYQIKIGKKLSTATGRDLAESLINQGFELFLDLEYHDIPHTVAQTYKIAAGMGAWMVDMHTSGGRHTMETTVEAVAGYHIKPLLIGVAMLTSTGQSDLTEINLNAAPEKQVIRLAKLAQSSGLGGVVCSAQETAPLRRELRRDFVLVTPGIRLDAAGNNDDQRRIMTPAEASAAGLTYLVMGRPITKAADPVAVLREVNRVADAQGV